MQFIVFSLKPYPFPTFPLTKMIMVMAKCPAPLVQDMVAWVSLARISSYLGLTKMLSG